MLLNPNSTNSGCTACAKQKGTTLVELLVVIVVFLVGILAVVQIFPKGFQILLTTRNNAQASALARDMVEHLKASPDQIPDAIVAVHYVNGTPIQDPGRSIYDLGPQGDSVDQYGNLYLAGTEVGNWLQYSGANSFRRIIGEGQRVPAPRLVGSLYGGLRLLAFGPIDSTFTPVFYANDLAKTSVLPQGLTSVATQTVNVGTTSSAPSVTVSQFTTPDSLSAYQYFVDQAGSSGAVLYLPTNSLFNRVYHLSLSAYVGTPSSFSRQDYTDLNLYVPLTTNQINGVTPPLIAVPISAILANTSGALQGGQSMASVEYDSIRVQPEYYSVASFGADPFQYETLDSTLGVYLFNPAAYNVIVEKPGGAREPLIAKANYDAKDWRILRQDFRLDSQLQLNGGSYAQFELAMPSLLVGTQTGPDGLPNGGLPLLEASTTSYAPYQSSLADNLMVIDIQTGGVVSEVDPNNASDQLITINKSTGMLTINAAPEGASGTITGFVLLPNTTTPVAMDLTARPLRVLYRARNNWAMFPTKAASFYSQVNTSPPAEGQVYVPASAGTRIYFPVSDLHQKVTVDQLFYYAGTTPKEIDGQDFVIEYPTGSNPVGLPCIDVTTVDSSASSLSTAYGAVARGIKGASLTVQVIWNPASFRLGTNATANIGLINTWGQSWRRTTNQTYLQTEDIQ
jgi:type II secretory pathway pseudopilin PulG